MGDVEEEWLWGWDPTPGIVSVWAEADGRAWVWRRVAGELVRDDVRFRPWVLLASLDDLQHLGDRLIAEQPGRPARGVVTYRELTGPGTLRWVVRADDGRALLSAVFRGASRRAERRIEHPREIG